MKKNRLQSKLNPGSCVWLESINSLEQEDQPGQTIWFFLPAGRLSLVEFYAHVLITKESQISVIVRNRAATVSESTDATGGHLHMALGKILHAGTSVSRQWNEKSDPTHDSCGDHKSLTYSHTIKWQLLSLLQHYHHLHLGEHVIINILAVASFLGIHFLFAVIHWYMVYNKFFLNMRTLSFVILRSW